MNTFPVISSMGLAPYQYADIAHSKSRSLAVAPADTKAEYLSLVGKKYRQGWREIWLILKIHSLSHAALVNG